MTTKFIDVTGKTEDEAVAKALAELVSPEELSPERIIPDPLDPRVVPAVARAVADAAKKTGVARI